MTTRYSLIRATFYLFLCSVTVSGALADEDSLPAPQLEEGAQNPAPALPPAPQGDELNAPAPLQAQEELPMLPIPEDENFAVARDRGETRREANINSGLYSRPMFVAYLGLAQRNFLSSNLYEDGPRRGPSIGLSFRMVDLADTVFLHAYADYSNFKIGSVKTSSEYSPIVAANVSSFRAGPIVEIGIGRRLSLFGSLLRRSDLLTADPIQPNTSRAPAIFYDNLAEPTEWRLGLGFLYDFYVIPHGAVGLRGQIEQDVYTISLSFAMEPVPRAKFNF